MVESENNQEDFYKLLKMILKKYLGKRKIDKARVDFKEKGRKFLRIGVIKEKEKVKVKRNDDK